MFVAGRGTGTRSLQSILRHNGPIPVNRISSSSRLLSTLAVLEQREGKLNVSSLAAISAAQKLGGPVTGFIAGGNTDSVVSELAKVKGLDKIIFVKNGAYDKVEICQKPPKKIVPGETSLTLLVDIRAFLRTSPLCSFQTYKKVASPIFWLAIRLLART